MSSPAVPSAPDPTAVALLPEATQRLLRTVDAMPDDAWPGPSLLPGWTRGHVVAHLTLNAEGLAGALRGVVRGEPTTMYVSQERRDADIDELATQPLSEQRARLLGATTLLADAVAAVPAGAWETRIERTPGGQRFPAAAVPEMRLREVEIHHADLGLGYDHTAWPSAFAASLVATLVRRVEAPLELRATDVAEAWVSPGQDGHERAVVSGTVADLGWWLSGRGNADSLTVESGDLPRIGAL